MNVGIVGCGLIGAKRAKVLGEHRLVIAGDKDIDRAQHICRIRNQGIATNDWKEVVAHPEVEIVIVATTNDWLTPVGICALEHNKHVLIEKPGARSSQEIELLFKKSMAFGKRVKIGFNLRYHPAMLKAKEISSTKEFGELMFVRGRYGHGGRLGYEKEWRADREISGGGELIDQGIHLIDLSRYFLGDFEFVDGFTHTYFWNMAVDDNAFLALKTKKQQMAWLHVSCTEWKNMFCFEIYGKYGKLQIDGLGGSYGPERLIYYKMLPQMGPPETKVWEYLQDDVSFLNEFNDFVNSLHGTSSLNGDLNDAYKALEIVDRIYKVKGE